MTSTPNTQFSASLGGAALCRIVGFTCLFGFLFDAIALTFPLGSGASWRASLLQQVGDRSIILLFALALLMYGLWMNRAWRKYVGYTALGVGVLLILCSILVVRDGLAIKSQALDTIGRQASELQSRVEEGQANPDVAAQVTPEDFANATRQIDAQAESLKQNATATVTKTSVTSTGNLIIVGAGLIGLGRAGISSKGGSTRRKVRPEHQPG